MTGISANRVRAPIRGLPRSGHPQSQGPLGKASRCPTLGLGMTVAGEVKNGRIYPNARVTAAIDLLLTSQTMAEAVRLTRERIGTQ
jgi:hypothetical protein